MTKGRFKAYLAIRYGNNTAEKIQSIFEFNKTLSFEEYRQNLLKLLSQRNLLLQLAFDVFDTNGDNRISELDLFKVFFSFNQSGLAE